MYLASSFEVNQIINERRSLHKGSSIARSFIDRELDKSACNVDDVRRLDVAASNGSESCPHRKGRSHDHNSKVSRGRATRAERRSRKRIV